ncbi:unnamed protein product [Acanthoscelides obtectus]|uniref:Uncharacterized protein n=1 Tax=Acanthoscelides obtectus TaxID=200917 RepID=A0A9P0KNS3_ACAOB|nr:unnamed protein product [Acanthoscelides obtectus]CAK1625644.1 hypothetical protein AOBTE_LOCUS3301 [Acanthoscelides obtectus]
MGISKSTVLYLRQLILMMTKKRNMKMKHLSKHFDILTAFVISFSHEILRSVCYID